MAKALNNELAEQSAGRLRSARAQTQFTAQDEQPDFTIVITSYNVGQFLNEALDSAFQQTLKRVEIIVVDDASTDLDTVRVLDEIAETVTVIRLPENGGVGVARNSGLQNATAPYILCLDGDDRIAPTYLQQAKAVFDVFPDVGVVGAYLQAFGRETWQWRPKSDPEVEDVLTSSPVPAGSCFRKGAVAESVHLD